MMARLLYHVLHHCHIHIDVTWKKFNRGTQQPAVTLHPGQNCEHHLQTHAKLGSNNGTSAMHAAVSGDCLLHAGQERKVKHSHGSHRGWGQGGGGWYCRGDRGKKKEGQGEEEQTCVIQGAFTQPG